MLKKILVKMVLFAVICASATVSAGLENASATTPAAKAGSATGVEKKSNAKVEKSHWGWTAGKVAGTAVGIVAGGAAGFFGTIPFIMKTLVESETKPDQKFIQAVLTFIFLGPCVVIATVPATIGAAGGGYAGYKVVHLLQKRFAKPQAVAEQKVEQAIEKTSC